MKMNPHIILEQAEKYRLKMEESITPLSEALSALTEGDISVFYIHGDGWVVGFGEDHVAACIHINFNELLSMSKDNVIKYLHERSI